MPDTPSSLGLTDIPNGSAMTSSPVRNNFSAIQTAVNALISALSAATAAGQVLGGNGTTLSWAYPPGYEMAYQAYTTDQTTTSTSLVDLFTFSAATFEGAKHYFEIVIPNLRASITGDDIIFQLMESATPIGLAQNFETSPTANQGVPAVARVPFTPTAAAHTYKVQWKTTFAGTATIKATVGEATFRIVKA